MHLRKVLESGMGGSILSLATQRSARLSLAASTSPGLEHVFQSDHQVTEILI